MQAAPAGRFSLLERLHLAKPLVNTPPPACRPLPSGIWGCMTPAPPPRSDERAGSDGRARSHLLGKTGLDERALSRKLDSTTPSPPPLAATDRARKRINIIVIKTPALDAREFPGAVFARRARPASTNPREPGEPPARGSAASKIHRVGRGRCCCRCLARLPAFSSIPREAEAKSRIPHAPTTPWHCAFTVLHTPGSAFTPAHKPPALHTPPGESVFCTVLKRAKPGEGRENRARTFARALRCAFTLRRPAPALGPHTLTHPRERRARVFHSSEESQAR